MEAAEAADEDGASVEMVKYCLENGANIDAQNMVYIAPDHLTHTSPLLESSHQNAVLYVILFTYSARGHSLAQGC